MFDIEEFEYKAPSFEAVDRSARKIGCDFAQSLPSRFSRGYDGIWASRSAAKESVSILIAGDLLCQENMVSAYAYEDGSFDFSWCFDFVRPLLLASDFAVGNLETPVSEAAPYRGEILTHEGPFYCNAPVEYARALKYAGFDMLTTANNHMLDAGARGLVDTVEAVNELGIIQTGTFGGPRDRFEIVDICGFKVGFVAFGTAYNMMDGNLTREGRAQLLNTYSEGRARRIYDEMKRRGAEYTICFPHWGNEYTSKISPKQLSMAKELTAFGYDFVAGSHSHVVQRFDTVNGKPVLYSLGNLISHLNLTSARKNSSYPVLCNVVLERKGDSVVARIGFIPCAILKGAKGVPYTVVPCDTGLQLDEAISSLVREAPGQVARMLGVSEDGEQIETKYPVVDCAGDDLLKQRADNPTPRKASPRSKCSTKPRRIELSEEEREQGWLLEGNCAIRLEGASAEIVRFSSTATVLRLKEEAGGKPVVEVGNDAYGNDCIRVLYVGSFVKRIGRSAFENFSRLESVRLFSGIESIGDRAFAGCSSITGITLPETCKSIGEEAFSGCACLLSVKILPSVIEIGHRAFEGCEKLTIYCEPGSFADAFARQEGIAVSHMPLSDIANTPFPDNLEREFMGSRCSEDEHPSTIRETCIRLDAPLPKGSVLAFPPSHYLGEDAFTGTIEEMKRLLGRRFPEIDEGELKKRHRLFRQEYEMQATMPHNPTDFTVYFCDWLMFARKRGFGHHCYFVYELYNKEPNVRDTFLNAGYRRRVAKACAPREVRGIFADKAHFNERFSSYVGRDWIDSRSCSLEEFEAFLSRHDSFFAKPVSGTGGAGARVIESASAPAELLLDSCKKDALICEEVVVQHESLARFNPSTLNTVRVTTLLCADGTPRILLAAARFGCAGNCVDNFHSGGMGAVLDNDTGEVVSPAIDMYHRSVRVHPDSDLSIAGFRYPEWERVKQTALEAAMLIPEVRHVGWDMAVTADGRVVIIEGNCMPGFDMMQSPDQVGKRGRYETYLREIEKECGIASPRLAQLKIAQKRTLRSSVLSLLKRNPHVYKAARKVWRSISR